MCSYGKRCLINSSHVHPAEQQKFGGDECHRQKLNISQLCHWLYKAGFFGSTFLVRCLY